MAKRLSNSGRILLIALMIIVFLLLVYFNYFNEEISAKGHF